MGDFEFDQADMVDVAAILSLMVVKSPVYAAVISVLEIMYVEFGCRDDYALASHYIRNLALIASDPDVWHLKGQAKVDAWYDKDESSGGSPCRSTTSSNRQKGIFEMTKKLTFAEEDELEQQALDERIERIESLGKKIARR